jgi:hypothetical protein
MKGKDRYSQRFDFDGEPPSPSNLVPITPKRAPRSKKRPKLLSVANNEIYNGYRRTISDGESFRRLEDSTWPLAEFETSRGVVHIQLRPESEEPLLPEEQVDIAERMFERAKGFSDLEGDVCDVLTINFLKEARRPDHRAHIETDDLCRMRGLKSKKAGNGRRGGYTPKQRLVHLNAAKSIFDSWIIAAEVPVYIEGKPPITRRLESRPFVVTDRIGDYRFSWLDSSCHDNCVDVLRFTYVVGEIFGAYLFANRQTALLSEYALKYNIRTHLWEKRLTRYYSHLWRCRMHSGDFSSPVRVSTIFAEGLRLDIDCRRLSRTQNHFAKAHRTLERDGVILGWRYKRNEGEWSTWTVVIEPPEKIRQHYASLGHGSVKTRNHAHERSSGRAANSSRQATAAAKIEGGRRQEGERQAEVIETLGDTP